MPTPLAEKFTQAAQAFGKTCAVRSYTDAEARRVWKVRESALGATVFVPNEKHGWEGWEDSAVPPDQLGSYLRENLPTCWNSMSTPRRCTGTSARDAFTCASPFDLETAEGIAKYREFIDEAADIVLAHGGSSRGSTAMARRGCAAAERCTGRS